MVSQSPLLIERQCLNLFHTADELDAGLFLRRPRALASPQQFIGGDFEDFGEAQDHIGVEAQLVRFVVGNQLLNEAGSLGNLLLRPSAFLAQASEALPLRSSR